VDQNRDIQSGPTDGIRDCALVAKIRQSDQDAIDLVTVLFEKVRTLLGVVVRLDGAKFCVFRGKGDNFESFFGEYFYYGSSA
jgi:hypothetical protein